MNRDLLQICSFCVYGPRAVKQNKCHSVGSPTPSSSSSPPRTLPGTRPLDGLVLLTWAFGRRCARNLKSSTFCSVAALARYMGQEVHHSPSETSTIAPWNKMQLTENKPLGRLYNPVPRQANAQVSRLLCADHQDTATLVAYTDASVSGTTIHTALVCPSIPEACQTCSYFADPAPPAHLAELAAIRDG
ncbi:hypothetical protein HPB52_008395 [Rhipicephalus sanguineus]|uniref:Uncharacterized protein n=1 Tax=Rhipicephalus sanguineus TaxID=34632 RepID=A0A9D4T801_RHISA|nr:hypothetical protein HPB52_008395 [Rhipicephalus sanguineus]